MEIYLLAAMLLLYIVTAVALNKNLLRKIWLAAFVIAFAVTVTALSFLRFGNQEVMMNAVELSWYYILYLFASIMSILGVINLWLFRHPLWDALFGKSYEDDEI